MSTRPSGREPDGRRQVRARRRPGVGPGVYDEAKRFSEALAFAYHRAHGVEIRIPRIFNTYGPRMRMDDGRAVPTFISQALAGEPLTVHGDVGQTRSLCYVDDLIDGLVRLLVSPTTGPVNIGSDYELTMTELAQTIIDATDSVSTIEYVPRPEDDPQVRRHDTGLAREPWVGRPRSRCRRGSGGPLHGIELSATGDVGQTSVVGVVLRVSGLVPGRPDTRPDPRKPMIRSLGAAGMLGVVRAYWTNDPSQRTPDLRGSTLR